MYDLCETCRQLFLDPEHLQVLCSDFSLLNRQSHTLSYRRRLADLRNNTAQRCQLCRRLVQYFNLDTGFWEGLNLGLSDEDSGDVVFAMCLVNMAPLVLTVSLEGAPQTMVESNWLAFELLTRSGKRIENALAQMKQHQIECHQMIPQLATYRAD